MGVTFLLSFFDTRTKLIICDIGQGDGIYLRIRNQFDIVIDAGPNDSILSCLGKYMPFYDRQIELAMITNSDLDHFYGFIPILDRYKVKTVFMPPHNKATPTFQKLLNKIVEEKSRVYFPVAGDSFNILQTNITFYWPTADFIQEAVSFPPPSSSNSLQSRLGTTTYDENEFSFIFLFTQGTYTALFTGDATPTALEKATPLIPFSVDRGINLLKVPHHGSKNGLTYEFLRLADPTLSVISVGKKNRYHLPSPEVLAYFKALKKRYLRTDEVGDMPIWIN